MADRDTPTRCGTCDQWQLTRTHVCPSTYQTPMRPRPARVTAALIVALVAAALVAAHLAGADKNALLGLAFVLGAPFVGFMEFVRRGDTPPTTD